MASDMAMPEELRQVPARAGREGEPDGEAVREPASDEALDPRHETGDTGKPPAALLHAAFTRDNLKQAFKRVRANKGAAGVDGLDIVRAHLDSGIMIDGVVQERDQGTPQGGPLSPLLSNVLLDEVDRELERRGHCFVRYANDANVYVRSHRAGERVMALLRRLYGGLKLKINEGKSAMASAFGRKFLGHSFWVALEREVRRRVADKPLATMRQRDATGAPQY